MGEVAKHSKALHVKMNMPSESIVHDRNGMRSPFRQQTEKLLQNGNEDMQKRNLQGDV